MKTWGISKYFIVDNASTDISSGAIKEITQRHKNVKAIYLNELKELFLREQQRY